ncbi:MAG: uracil-DNA glycosylase [Deltaproteobacteria bacterium]|nr:uracil-DNA glycosylase [Deltaproteobacteria bacterium]
MNESENFLSLVERWLRNHRELGLKEVYLSPRGVESLLSLTARKSKTISLEKRGQKEKPRSPFLIAEGFSLEELPRGQKGLDLIRKELGNCTRCRLSQGRTHLVFGEGNPEAELMFVGEGPGREEDLQGVPFVGRAGQLLTKIIEAMGMKRGDVYIANVVKCRPPDNRAPLPDEIATCIPFLIKQIAVIRPKVIVALGKIAAQALLNTTEPITKLRGRFHLLGDILVMPTFHPAYLLRNPAMKRYVWEDMKLVRKEIDKIRVPS